VVTLEARVAELTRPKHPEEFGLHVRLTPTEAAIVLALLPPGEIVHRDALIARVWPDVVTAGLVDVWCNPLRMHVSRIRRAVRAAGWSLPNASLHHEYVLLRPGQALPLDFEPSRRDMGGAAPDRQYVPCARGCGGLMARRARRCLACRRGDEATARRQRRAA
jgi:hypothetical protein